VIANAGACGPPLAQAQQRAALSLSRFTLFLSTTVVPLRLRKPCEEDRKTLPARRARSALSWIMPVANLRSPPPRMPQRANVGKWSPPTLLPIWSSCTSRLTAGAGL